MAFFRKADAKVRQISEPAKLFEENFQKVFISIGSQPFPCFSMSTYPLSLSKAGAKLLLYNISAKSLHHVFQTFLQIADSQRTFGEKIFKTKKKEVKGIPYYFHARVCVYI